LVAALAVGGVSLSWLEVRVNFVLNHNGNAFFAVQIHYQQGVSLSGIIVHRQACVDETVTVHPSNDSSEQKRRTGTVTG
jgi:hypothetical protein